MPKAKTVVEEVTVEDIVVVEDAVVVEEVKHSNPIIQMAIDQAKERFLRETAN